MMLLSTNYLLKVSIALLKVYLTICVFIGRHCLHGTVYNLQDVLPLPFYPVERHRSCFSYLSNYDLSCDDEIRRENEC